MRTTKASARRLRYCSPPGYVHAVAPWVKVGVTVTYDGAVGQKGQVADLNSRSDIFILTYYPLGPRFIPRVPMPQ